MKQEHKLYAAIGAMVVLAIAAYMVMGEREKAAEARSGSSQATELPTVKLSKEEAAKVTKFVIANKDKGEVTLVKKGDEWMLDKPLSAKANQKNIKSIVDNLEKIEVTAVIGEDAAIHEKYELTEGKGIHVQAFKGDEKVLDMYFGKSGSRGQMARFGGDGAKPTVYATKGYSSYVWGREVRSWRHSEILSFEEGNVIAAELENEHGKFSFTKADDAWSAKLYKRDEEGALAKKGSDIENFEEDKVSKFLQAFKALKATNFAEEKDDTGVDEAVKNGGVVKITMKDETKPKYVIHLGNTQEGSNRFLKVDGDDTVYIVTSFTADWAKANAEKFQKVDDPKDKVDENAKDKKKGDDKSEKKDAPKAKGKAADAPKPKAPKAPAPKPEGK